MERRQPRLRAELRSVQFGRQRRVRRDGGSESREPRLCPDLQSRPPEGVGQARQQLGVLGGHPARDRPARVGGRRLLPPLVLRLSRHRQPVGRAVRLQSIQHHRADGSAAAGRRRPRRLECVQPESGEVRRCGKQLRDVGSRLRDTVGVLAWRRRQRGRADAERRRAARRSQHGPSSDRPLRDPRGIAGDRAGGDPVFATWRRRGWDRHK